MDKLTKTQRRKNMQAVKSKGSMIESLIANELWGRGLRYRRNNKKNFGNPDFAFIKQKIAVFVDSEFWHGYQWAKNKENIKTNREFWIHKIERNIARDLEVNKKLQEEGWIVLRFWGNNILKNTESCVNLIWHEILKIKNEENKNH